MVQADEEIEVEKLPSDQENIEFDTLLRVHGEDVEFGDPILKKSTKAVIVGSARGPKKQGMKTMPSGYRKKFGHRQEYVKVKIVEL